MSRTEIRITGFGGQGVVLCGHILGRTIVQNIVMLGFISAVTKLVPKEAMRDAVKDSVPPGTVDLNLAAFGAGWEHYEKTCGSFDQME